MLNGVVRHVRRGCAEYSRALFGIVAAAWHGRLAGHRQSIIVLGLFLGFLLLRLPFRSDYPVNWDAVQFGLGIQEFDLKHHQPHPPGYIGYIALGKLVNFIVDNPHASLTLIATVAGAIVPAMFYPLARRFMSDRFALFSTVSFGASILAWYYSEVALTYVVELALLLPFLFLIHRAIMSTNVSRELLLASGVLAMVGSFRQTALALMLPLWVYALWRHDWSDRLRAGGVMVGVVLIWLIPLLWLAGGPVEYFNLSRDLAEITGGNTSVLSLDPVGPAKNIGFVLAGAIIGVNAAAAILLAGHPAITRWLASSSRQDRVFLVLWALPALAVYVFGHTGQIGYILILLPIPFLGLGIALPYVSQAIHRVNPVLQPGQAVLGLVALLVAINVVGFLALPPMVSRAKPESVPLDVRQFDLRSSDAHWREITGTIRNYPADNTVILTTIGGPRVSGSYRHLSYMLPEYHVYGMGKALENDVFGPLFYAHDGRNNYRIAAMQDADERLELPLDTRYIIIPDDEIVERIESSLDEKTDWTDQRGGLMVIIVEPGTSLVFSIRGNIITFSECGSDTCTTAPSRGG